MKKVDLMFCCLGNGVTVCDRSRLEHGDYKTVAHIDPCGAVKLYDGTIPPEALEKIDSHAAAQARNFKHGFVHLGRAAALDMLYDRMTPGQLVARESSEGQTMEQIYRRYIEIVCENDKRTMPKEQ